MVKELLLLDGEGFISILKTGHFYFHLPSRSGLRSPTFQRSRVQCFEMLR